MAHTFINTIPMRGDLRIVVRHADSGEVRWRYEIRNMIMYNALKGMVNLLSQTGTPDNEAYKLAYLRVGTGTLTPVRTHLDLETPATEHPATDIFTLPITDGSKFATTSGTTYELKVVATIESGSLNGQQLTEAGLFTYGTTISTPGGPAVYAPIPTRYPELFARQVHPAIPKSSAFVVDYDWRIAFTS